MSAKRIISATRIRKYNSINYLVITTVCLCLLIMASCSSGRARTRGNLPEGKTADELISVMKARLNLTDEQEIQIRPLIEEECAERKEIIEKYAGQGRGSRGVLIGELQGLQKTTETKLETILTEEQMKEYRKLRSEELQTRTKSSQGRRRSRF